MSPLCPTCPVGPVLTYRYLFLLCVPLEPLTIWTHLQSEMLLFGITHFTNHHFTNHKHSAIRFREEAFHALKSRIFPYKPWNIFWVEAALFLISWTLKSKQLAVRSFALGIFAFIYAIIQASAAFYISCQTFVFFLWSCWAINTPQHTRSLSTADKLEGENK